MVAAKTSFEQVHVETIDQDVVLTTSVGRTDHPEWQDTPITWQVSLRCERSLSRLGMDTGWCKTLIEATVQAGEAREAMKRQYAAGEWEGDPDEPF